MSRFTLSLAAEEDLIQIYVEGATAFGLAQAQRYVLRVRHGHEDWLEH